jgi:hypothetical protein
MKRLNLDYDKRYYGPIDRAPSRLMALNPPKMQAGRDVLRRRANNPHRAECLVGVDRLQGVCMQNPTPAVMEVERLRSVRKSQIRRPTKGSFQPYGCAHWFHSTRNGMKVAIESDRQELFVSPYRLTLFADDWTGLLLAEAFSVLERVPDFG